MSLQPGQMFQVNLEAVEKLQNITSCVKLAIVKAKAAGYYSLEEFLRDISLNDLVMLQTMFDAAMNKDQTSLELAVLISVTLAQLEGVSIEQESSAKEFFGTMFIGLNLEGLQRKGILMIKRENMNFLAVDEPVMELTDLGRQIADNLKGKQSDV